MESEKCQNLETITGAIFNGDSTSITSLVSEELEKGADPKVVFEALAAGIIALGEKLSKKEAFLPELVVGFDAFKKGMEILEPLLKKLPKEGKTVKVVLGTVQGDIHTVGKNIVKTMLEAAGCEVYDLGVDVPPEKFVEKVVEVDAEILGCSCLISIGILSLRKTVEKAKAARDNKTAILIGGFTTSPELANEIGAIYCKDAFDAIKYIKALKGGE